MVDIAKLIKREQSNSSSVDSDGKATRGYGQRYRVLVGSARVDSAELRAAIIAAVPKSWSTDPAARLNGMDLERVDGAKKIWDASATYSTDAPSSSGIDNILDANPLLVPPKRRLRMAQHTTTIYKDLDDKPIVNQIENPDGKFNPEAFDGLEVDDPRPELTVSWNASAFPSEMAYQYRRAVNTDNYCGFPPRTLRVVDLEAEEAIATVSSAMGPVEIHYFPASVTLQAMRDEWFARIANAGLKALIDKGQDGVVHERVKDEDGEDVDNPVLLDDRGYRLGPGKPPFLLKFRVYEEKPFGGFFPKFEKPIIPPYFGYYATW